MSKLLQRIIGRIFRRRRPSHDEQDIAPISPFAAVVSAALGIGLWVLLWYAGFVDKLLEMETKHALLVLMGITLVGVVLLHSASATRRRLEAEYKNHEQAFFDLGMEKLDSHSASARLEGIHTLHKIAVARHRRARSIVEILCAYMCSATSKDSYRENHKDKPSEEIQALLHLLTGEPSAALRQHLEFYNLDFGGACLNGADLSKADLSGANLARAWLQGAMLLDAQLQGAKLVGAQLQHALLLRAQLQHADLTAAQLQDADCWEAQLQGAKLTAAQLQSAHLHQVRLQGAQAKNAQMRDTILFGAQLQGADFQGANLQGANLCDAQLQGVVFDEAQLQSADIFRSRLQGARFQGANLQGSNFCESQLQNTHFHNAKLQGAIFFRAQLQGADFQGAHLQSVVFCKTQMQGVNFQNANLQGADLRIAQLQGACFEAASLQAAELFCAQLQGALCEKLEGESFAEKIKSRTGKDTNLSAAVFSGGLTQQGVDALRVLFRKIEKYVNRLKIQTSKEQMSRAVEVLQEHVDQPMAYGLPEYSGAETGVLNKEEAEEIIRVYEEAMAWGDKPDEADEPGGGG